LGRKGRAWVEGGEGRELVADGGGGRGLFGEEGGGRALVGLLVGGGRWEGLSGVVGIREAEGRVLDEEGGEKEGGGIPGKGFAEYGDTGISNLRLGDCDIPSNWWINSGASTCSFLARSFSSVGGREAEGEEWRRWMGGEGREGSKAG
jgi:hypothetical protein